MSVPSRPARLLAAGGLAAVALAGVASPAQALQTKTLNYQCKYPLVGAKPLSIKIDLDIPNSFPVNTPTPQYDVTATASAYEMAAAFNAVEDLHSIEGVSTAYTTVTEASGATQPADTVATIPRTEFTGAIPNPIVLVAKGMTPVLTFTQPGPATFSLDRLAINLTARDTPGDPVILPPVTKDLDGNKVGDSDGLAETFDVYCKLDAGQDTTIGGTEVLGATPTPTPPPTVTPTPPPTVTPTPPPTVTPTPPPTVTPTPPPTVTPTPPPTVTPTPPPTVTPTPPPTVTPTPPPGGTAKFKYTLSGSTRINTLTRGTLPLTGAIDATLTVATGDYTATTALNDTQGRLIALGFLPVSVSIGFVPSGPTTGKLDDDQLTANLKLRIKVKSVKAFGIIPLAGGNSCQTKELSDISLKSTDSFDPTGTGGTLGGTYKISDLNGCGPLNGLVSPLTAGGGNTITAKLTPAS